MKILFVCHDANLSGAPKIGFEIARYLSSQAEITMVVKKSGHLLNSPEYKSTFRKIINARTSHEISGYSSARRTSLAKKILLREHPDLLYVNSVAASDWCRAGKECNIPVVLHSHEMKNELLALEYVKIFERNVAEFVDLLITVSPDAERDIVELCTVPFKRTLSSSPGINFKAVQLLAARNDFALPVNIFGHSLQKSKPLISMCGYACRRKGSDIFFQSAKRLPQFDFLWIGPWNKRQAPGNIAYKEYKRSRLSNFYLTNETFNPYPYLKLSDLFVLTSREDPNPLVVMEALYLSKLCMGFSSTGGSRDLLNRFGVLLQGEITLERLVSAIEQYEPSSLSYSLGEKEKEIFTKGYDLERIVGKIKKEIFSLLNGQ